MPRWRDGFSFRNLVWAAVGYVVLAGLAREFSRASLLGWLIGISLTLGVGRLLKRR